MHKEFNVGFWKSGNGGNCGRGLEQTAKGGSAEGVRKAQTSSPPEGKLLVQFFQPVHCKEQPFDRSVYANVVLTVQCVESEQV